MNTMDLSKKYNYYIANPSLIINEEIPSIHQVIELSPGWLHIMTGIENFKSDILSHFESVTLDDFKDNYDYDNNELDYLYNYLRAYIMNFSCAFLKIWDDVQILIIIKNMILKRECVLIKDGFINITYNGADIIRVLLVDNKWIYEIDPKVSCNRIVLIKSDVPSAKIYSDDQIFTIGLSEIQIEGYSILNPYDQTLGSCELKKLIFKNVVIEHVLHIIDSVKCIEIDSCSEGILDCIEFVTLDLLTIRNSSINQGDVETLICNDLYITTLELIKVLILTKLPPNMLGRINNINLLTIDGTNLREIIASQFGECKTLKELVITNNLNLISIHGLSLDGLTSLKILTINNNDNLISIGSELIKGLNSLLCLRINNNKKMNSLELLENKIDLSIQQIEIMNNDSIVGIAAATFSGLSNVRSMSLVGNNLRLLPSKLFVKMQDLCQLDLSCNKIEFVEDLAFHGLTSLRKLDLRNNLIVSSDIVLTQEMPQLELLLI